MDTAGQALDLISKYGLPLVGTVVGFLAVVWLFRRIEAQWQARLDYVDARRVEERTGRLDAEARLASNSETLREATGVFAASQQFQQQLMEQLIERNTGAGGRRGG